MVQPTASTGLEMIDSSHDVLPSTEAVDGEEILLELSLCEREKLLTVDVVPLEDGIQTLNLAQTTLDQPSLDLLLIP